MTQGERIAEALRISGVTVAEIARACGISQQAIYQWISGETKQILGEYLVEVAELTGYDARWLAKEIGPKIRLYPKTAQQAHVLKVMQSMPEDQASLIVKIADSVAEPPAKSSNGR